MRKLTLAAVAMLAIGSVQAQTMDKAAVEKIVKDYIASHGTEVLASIRTAQEAEAMQKFRTLVGANTPTMGPANAKVTIVEISEFQCPYCGKVQPTLNELRTEYGNKIRWAYKNMPLEFHPQARPAAYAAMAAHQQGKFWEFSKKLWAGQATLNEELYVKSAKELKLDMAKFDADRKSAKIKAIVDADLKQAGEAGASGTPFFVINGKGVSGALPKDVFKKIIDEELAAK